MHDHGTGAGIVRKTDRAARVQESPLFGKQRRHFLERLPVTPGFIPRLRLREVGQVHRETADHLAGGVVQFNARREAFGREARLRPDKERCFRWRRPGRRRLAGAHQVIERDDAVDLDQGLFELRMEILALVGDLWRVARFDQLAARTLRGVDQRRIENQRRNGDRQERQQQPRRLRSVAIDRRVTMNEPRTDRRRHGDQHRRPLRRAIIGRQQAEEDRRRQQPQADGPQPPRQRAAREHPRRPREPQEENCQTDDRGVQRDQTDDHGDTHRIEIIEREADDVDRCLRHVGAQQPLVREHECHHRAAGDQLHGVEQERRRTTVDHDDADPGPARGAPHREARHCQDHEARNHQRVQQEVDGRRERDAGPPRPRCGRQERHIREARFADGDPGDRASNHQHRRDRDRQRRRGARGSGDATPVEERPRQ